MAIVSLFEQEKTEEFTETFESGDHTKEKLNRNSLFSPLVTRLCFFLLLMADLAWLLYTIFFVSLSAFGFCLTGGKSLFLKKYLQIAALQFRRSLACALSLFIGLFTPPFGIMVACTYFLMYDKDGMEAVVPAGLQSQFKEIFAQKR